MFFLKKITHETQAMVGDTVMVLSDFAGIQAGDRGKVVEIYNGGITIEWIRDYSWGRTPETDGFGRDDLEYLAFGTPHHPQLEKFLAKQNAQQKRFELDKIIEEGITKEDEKEFYKKHHHTTACVPCIQVLGGSGIGQGGKGGNGGSGNGQDGAGGKGGDGWSPLMGVSDLKKQLKCHGACCGNI